MRKSISIYDLAQIAGVSPSTVSKALNGKGTIAEKTREHVLEVARREGYVASYAARTLGERNTHTVGIITPDVSNPFYSSIIRKVDTLLADQGYVCVVSDSDNKRSHMEHSLQVMVERQVDGLVFVNGRLEGVTEDLPSGLPAVLIDATAHIERPWTVSVSNDFQAMVQDDFRHLVAQGCTNIALVSVYAPQAEEDQPGDPFGLRTLAGELGLPFGQRLLLRGYHQQESRLEAADLVGRYLDEGGELDGIVCLGDRIALGACDALRKRGATIGRDVKVIGMDDSLFSRVAVPAISSIDRHTDEMAERGVRALLDMIEGTEPQEHFIVIGHDIVARESTLG